MLKFIQSIRNLGLGAMAFLTIAAYAASPTPGPFMVSEGDAQVGTIIESDSMAPYVDVESARVSFFSVAVYKKDTVFAKKGERALILSTVGCTDKTIRRTMTEKIAVGSDTAERLFPNDEGVTQSLQTQAFRTPTSAELQEVEGICRNFRILSDK